MVDAEQGKRFETAGPGEAQARGAAQGAAQRAGGDRTGVAPLDLAREAAALDPDKLLAVIRLQTSIAEAPLAPAAVMDTVARSAMDLCGAEGAVVELQEGEEMFYAAAVGIAERQIGLRIPRKGSLSGLTVEAGMTLICEDSESDPRVNREACRRVGLRSMIVAPLRYQGRGVGVLKVMKRSARGFGTKDQAIIELLTNLMAAGIAHAEEHRSSLDAAEALYRRATFDGLTGLHNRASFYDRLRQAIISAERYGQGFGLAIIDLDGLKQVNDGIGHLAGDALLREMGRRLDAAVRRSDLAARIGGDEFALLLQRFEDEADRENMTRKLLASLDGPLQFEGRTLNLSASIGLSRYPQDGTTPEALVKAADAAMYDQKRAKKADRNSREGVNHRGSDDPRTR